MVRTHVDRTLAWRTPVRQQYCCRLRSQDRRAHESRGSGYARSRSSVIRPCTVAHHAGLVPADRLALCTASAYLCEHESQTQCVITRDIFALHVSSSVSSIVKSNG